MAEKVMLAIKRQQLARNMKNMKNFDFVVQARHCTVSWGIIRIFKFAVISF